MKVKVTITPVKTTSASYFLSGVYKAKNGTMRILNENDDVVEWNKDVKDMPRGRGFYFTKTRPQVVIEYEDNEKVSEKEGTLFQDRKNKRKAEVFYANHVNLTVNGKRHANSVEHPDFNMDISTDIVAMEHAQFRDTLLVKNRLNAMSENLEEIGMVADYYGISPKNKTALDLLILLGGDKGLCLEPVHMKTFLRNWMNPNEDTLLMVNIRKAIRMQVIEEKNTAGRIDYYLGTTHLGMQIEDLIAYCRNNPTIYTDHILRKVKEEKLTAEQEATEKMGEKISGVNQKMSASEIQDLRNEAVQLKKEKYINKKFRVDVMGANENSLQKLIKLVDEARKLKEEKEAKELA